MRAPVPEAGPMPTPPPFILPLSIEQQTLQVLERIEKVLKDIERNTRQKKHKD